jgi:acyl carrier protein
MITSNTAGYLFTPHPERKRTVTNSAVASPTRAEVEHAVIGALARTLRIPESQVLPGSMLESELGLDSMGMINVNIALEERFSIVLNPCEEPEGVIRTVDDLVNAAAKRLELSC